MGCGSSRPQYGGGPAVSQASMGNDVAAIARRKGLGRGGTFVGQGQVVKRITAQTWTGPKKFDKQGNDMNRPKGIDGGGEVVMEVKEGNSKCLKQHWGMK